MSSPQARHDVLVKPNHDEAARQSLCQALRAYLLTDVKAGTREVFERRVAPRFAKDKERPMQDRHEVRRAMNTDPFYRLFSASLRSAQELIWDSVIDTVERDLSRVEEQRPKEATSAGSLTLDPSLQIPRYHTAADIHLQPGGYHTEHGEDDIVAGAIFDRALFVYGNGGFGDYNECMGQGLCELLQEQRPDFRPRRILDLGCTVGNSTLPYVDVFPHAEVHAIDVAAPCLRYGHLRAEALGKPVHFAQMNAEAMDYEDGSFDLIVSHLLFHETGRTAFRNILAECHRLLAPGGLMAHLDIPTAEDCDDLYDSFMWDWEAYHNNETFEVVVRNLDHAAEAVAAGFSADTVRRPQGPFGWPVLIAEKE